MSAVWQGDPLGPGRHPQPEPAHMLVLPDRDHPRLTDLDGWLGGDDAPRTIPAPPVPREKTTRHLRLGACAPGTVNPPGRTVRNQGAGAQLVGDPRTDGRRRPLDQLHDDLGEFLDELVLECGPAPAVRDHHHGDLGEDPGALFGMGHLAKKLSRKPDTLRVWIRRGWMPDAAHRGPGGSFGHRRYWTAAEVELIVSAAHDAGIITNHGHDVDLTETEFSARVRLGLERLRVVK